MNTLRAFMLVVRPLWKSIGLVLLFNSLFFLLVLFKPGSHDVFVAMDNGVQAIGAFLGVLLGLEGMWRLWRRGVSCRGSSEQERGGKQEGGSKGVPLYVLLLTLAVGGQFVGQGIYTYYEQILHQLFPFPSWADVGYLSTYPFLLLGILLLPTRRLSGATRWRVLTDGLMIMTAVVTFSWYFILGPTLQQSGVTVFAKIVGAAYPFSDLVIIFCLLLLSYRSSDPRMRLGAYLLSLGLGFIVIADSTLDYQTLQSSYATGEFIDIGWSFGYMLIGVAVQAFCLLKSQQPVSGEIGVISQGSHVDIPSLWRSLLPYLLVPAVGLLILYIQFNGKTNNGLELSIYLGGAVLITLVLLRQVFAVRETIISARQTHHLYEELHLIHDELHANNAELSVTQQELQTKNRALAAANTSLEALATTDPLTELPNHRALIGVLDQELQRSQRSCSSCSLFFLDIDHFKALNDGYGHSVGDAVLREFASTVRANLRVMDTLGRWGGEEFVAILPETNREDALSIAERIRAAIAAHAFSIGGGLHLTCSVGIATSPFDAEEREGLIAASDRAMYGAKKLGRNQVRAVNEQAIVALETEQPGSREEAALAGTVEALSALVEARDHYTGQHTLRVSTLTTQLALALGLDTSEAYMMGLAGHLHDVGKIAVPDAVLQKPARLTEEEWVLMRTHPTVGSEVVSHVPSLRAIAPIIRAHHERWDGDGYPDRLAGETIPLGARIVSVVDSYEAIITNRPYQQARTSDWALAELRRCSGTQFDPRVIEALALLLTTGMVQSVSEAREEAHGERAQRGEGAREKKAQASGART
ncbi:MAG: diguanylate cyclase [Ktedonobacteraceae bacterium]